MTSPLPGDGDRAGELESALAAQVFRPSMVHVDRVYEVVCDATECNGNFDSEFYADRADAAEARRVHVEQHYRDAALERAQAGRAS